MTLRQMTDMYDLQVKWCDLYVESALFEFEQTCSENVYMENAECSNVLMEAEEKAGNKISTAIKTMFSKLKEYLSGVVNKIKNAGIKDKMEKMKSSNSSETIEVDDPKEVSARLSAYKNETIKCREKVTKGQKLTDDDKEAVENAKKRCNSPVKKKVKMAAAVLGASIGGGLLTYGLADLNSKMDRVSREYDAKIRKVDNTGASAVATSGQLGNDVKEQTNDYYYAARAEAEYLRMEAIQNVKNANLFNKIFGFLFAPAGVNKKSQEEAKNKRDDLIDNYNKKYNVSNTADDYRKTFRI